MCNKTAIKMVPGDNFNAKLPPKATNPKVAAEPSILARYTCASILVGIFAIWGKYTFVPENEMRVGKDLHDYRVPLAFTVFYLGSLPLLREMIDRLTNVDMKLLLKESMILYNAGQVVLNAWMVYRILDALILRGHPFVGSLDAATSTGATYAVWVHYCDKYLEFMDTYFMVLRGKMDQVVP
jgi:elongation of very long chain fatty acids protein 4